MAAAASSSSSPSGRDWKYHVFLSFRGEDTRKIFIGHLYQALNEKSLKTFIDSGELRKGNDLCQLFTAIQESRVSIVVFSQNYAASTWCLKELVHILKCKEEMKQIVVPVFYDVNPSDIRKLKGSFAQAFAQHEGDSNAEMNQVQSWRSALARAFNFLKLFAGHEDDSTAEMDEVQSWRSALKRATDLSGWDSRIYPDDAKLIEDIVHDVLDKLNHISSSKEDNGLIGMDSHIREMDLLLHPVPGADDVRVVGIWGMGGIGKTTIATAVYHKIACQFEACCFLENVKEGFFQNGAVPMLEKLLSSILNEKVCNSGSLDSCSQMIRERLGRKKVVLVLDDVDTLVQIEALIGMQHSLGGGSRIIITTRDMQLLRGADAIYNPQVLNHSGALELFRRYAFKTNQPTQEFDALSRRAIQYAQGLPLALKVLGAFLDNKSVREWEDVLEKLKKIPQQGIHDVLKTSFHGLDDSEKNIFLDIACFFKGQSKDYATKVLDGCGFFPHTGIRVLVDRALVVISKDTLEMHDLLAEMGREIVRQESIKEPGKRSRLWSYPDVYCVLTQNTATETVESIILKYDDYFEERSVNRFPEVESEIFVNMAKLRLLRIEGQPRLRIDNYNLDSCCSYLDSDNSDLFLSPEVRCLLWNFCPLKSFTTNFYPNNLVHLSLQNSLIEQLWEGIKALQMLKIIDLSGSKYLKKIPDFTQAKNLEEIILDGCVRLFEVHPSILTLENLVLLTLKRCYSLKNFPSSIGMKSLKILDLYACSNFEKFSEISEVMEELSELDLGGTAVNELSSSINNLTGIVTLTFKNCRNLKSLPRITSMKSLKILDLSGCSNFEKFPEISEGMVELSELCLVESAIKELPSSINNLTGLITLNLNGCKELQSLPSITGLKSLKTLHLSGCSNFDKFPEISEVMEELSALNLERTAIKDLPSSINNLTGLVILTLQNCINLKSLPSITGMKSLQILDLSGCSNLDKFPEISEVIEELSELNLKSTAIKELPSSVNNLTGLVTLQLEGCRNLKSRSSSIGMKSLKILVLSGCTNLEKFPEVSVVMGELSKLNLQGTAIKELPSSIRNLRGIVSLQLEDCRELRSLPSSICQIKSLKRITLSGCSSLENFPEISESMPELLHLFLDGTAIKELPSSIDNLTRLRTLDLRGCIELKSLPSSICHLKSLEKLTLSGCTKFDAFPNIEENMEELKELHLDGTSIKALSPSIERLEELVLLNLKHCKSLVHLPDNLCNLTRLKGLNLSGCSNLSKLPENLNNLESLWDAAMKFEKNSWYGAGNWDLQVLTA